MHISQITTGKSTSITGRCITITPHGMFTFLHIGPLFHAQHTLHSQGYYWLTTLITPAALKARAAKNGRCVECK